MQVEQFDRQMNRLKDTYGAKFYPAEREKTFWEAMKSYDHWQFDKAVTLLINESFSPPSLSKVIGTIQGFQSNRPKSGAERDQEVSAQFNCEPCRDFGYGWIGETLVACTCELGQRIGPAELAKHHANYDRGKKFLKTPADLKRFLEGA